MDGWSWEVKREAEVGGGGIALMYGSGPNSSYKRAIDHVIWLLGVLEIHTAACPVNRLDKSRLQQLSVSRHKSL
jgi:hypothetical protein